MDRAFSLKHNKNISAEDADYREIYFCPECNQPVHLRIPRDKDAHFYHKKHNPECYLSIKGNGGWDAETSGCHDIPIDYRERSNETIVNSIKKDRIDLIYRQPWALNPINHYIDTHNSPQNVADHFMLATASLAKEDYDWAIRYYTEAIRGLSEAICNNPQYADIIKPHLAAVYNNRGNAYFRKGDFNRAIQDHNKEIQNYTEVIRLSPQNTDTIKPHLAAAYNNRGTVYSRKGDFVRAIQDYDEALRINPSLTAARDNRQIVINIQRKMTRRGD